MHGARVRAPVGFEYKKGLVHDLSMHIGHTKFNFTLLDLIDTSKIVLAKLKIVPKSARRTNSCADKVLICVMLCVKWTQGLQLNLF